MTYIPKETTMWYYIIKLLISSVLIVAISEISKRSSLLGAILASLPLVSVLAILWLYHDTKDVKQVSQLSIGVFWMVLPSLAFFVILPLMLKLNINFYLSMLIASAGTVVLYFILIAVLGHFGVKL